MVRADVALVERGLAPTRSAAQRLIAAGAVTVDRGAGAVTLAKAGEPVDASCALAVVDADELRFASRGGLKLQAALACAAVDVRGVCCLDIGQSTGGFTDCLLAAGAAFVLGVDVGHGQLHRRLAADPRVATIEGLNVRALSLSALRDALAADPPRPAADPPVAGGATRALGALVEARTRLAAPGFAGFDLAVADLSFISLAKALAPVASTLAPGGTLLALVKPQFEAGRAHVGKGGIVRDDPQLSSRIERDLREAARGAGLACDAFFDSPIAGGDGNRERFLHAHRIETPT